MTSPSLSDTIAKLARSTVADFTKFRHDLHCIPEPSQGEEKTARYIAERLCEMGIPYATDIAGHGVCALIDSGIPGPTVMLRADMDALPITEQSGIPCSSQHDGFMHACGHDCHMAMILGTAHILRKLVREPQRYRLRGSVKLLFQPAEEYPGGAKPMIDAGVMEQPHVDYCLGAHIWPDLPQGTVAISPGPVMAAVDRFDITIHGKGGHAAKPHQCVDALEVGTQVVGAMQRIISRKVDPLQPALLTVGEFHAGSAFNIIPGEAHISGTLRTLDPGTRHGWEPLLRQVTNGICTSMGARSTLLFRPGYPPVVNDGYVSTLVAQTARNVLGKESVLPQEQSMAGEDMAYFLHRAPGCFFFLGSGFKSCAPLHNPHFFVHDVVMLPGVEIFCKAVVALLCKDVCAT